jgi:hypothetical protein
MVVQSTTLIIRIGGAVVVLAIIMMGMMMVHVSNPAAFSEVGGNVLLVIECMLNMYAD